MPYHDSPIYRFLTCWLYRFLKSDDATASGSVDKFALAHSTQFISGSELIAFAYMIQSVAGEKNTEAARIFNNQALGEFGATFLLASVTFVNIYFNLEI